MATEGNGVLGSSEAAPEGQQIGPPLDSVAGAGTEDIMQSRLPLLEPQIHRLNGDGREWSIGFEGGGQLMDRTLQSIAAFLMGDSTENTFSGQQEYYLPGLVREAFEHCMKSGPAMVGGSSVNRREQIQEPDRRNLQLRFQTSMPDLFFVGEEVKGLDGATICVKLIDPTTGHVVESGPLSSLTLDVVVLAGDFKNKDDDRCDWKDFERNVETGRERKRRLLEGNLQVPLKAGVGYLAGLKFTDISYSRSGKFRLGVKVEQGSFQDIRVREAKTAAFRVIHSKKDAKEKHVPRALDDDICKLICIGDKGRKNLNGVGIFKVEDFLWNLCLDPEGLRKILGKTMSDLNWKTLGEHAKKSVPSGKYHVYYADNTKNSGVVFKNMSELCGLIEDGKYYWAETVSDSQKVFADTLKKEAYAKWMDIVEYDGLLPLEMNPRKRARSSQTHIVALEYCPSDIDQQVSPAFLTHVAPQPGLVNPGLAVGAPVPCQLPSVLPREASKNSVPDFEDMLLSHFYADGFDAFLCDVDPSHLAALSWDPSGQANGTKEVSAEDFEFDAADFDFDGFLCNVDPSHLPASSWDPSGQANGTKEVSAEGLELDAFLCDVDPSHLPASSRDPSGQANGTKEVSAEAHGGSFEQEKQLGGGGIYDQQDGLNNPVGQGNVNMGVGNTCSLRGNVIMGAVTVVGKSCSLGGNVITGAVTVVGGNENCEGGDARRREMGCLDSKFEGLSVDGPVD